MYISQITLKNHSLFLTDDPLPIFNPEFSFMSVDTLPESANSMQGVQMDKRKRSVVEKLNWGFDTDAMHVLVEVEDGCICVGLKSYDLRIFVTS